MRFTFLLIIGIFLSCSGLKQVSHKQPEVLPTYLMYSGIPQPDSVKVFITQYLLAKKINIISEKQQKILLQKELQRSMDAAIRSSNIISTDTGVMGKIIRKQMKYAVNSLVLNFKPIDSEKILLGWSNFGLPGLTSGRKEIIYSFLINEFKVPLSTHDVKILCDTVVASGHLYKK